MNTPTEDTNQLAALCRKLNEARTKVHTQKLDKSGRNTFAGYDYFELADFLPATLAAFSEVGLCGIVSFTRDEARLRIVDTESGAHDDITSPMSEANLKGCHAVQNLGAVQTYLRRYLWSAAIELSEHDAVDSGEPVNGAPPANKSAEKPPPSPLKLGEQESFTAVVRAIDKSDGKKKTGEAWTRYTIAFDNDRKASTFDDKIAGVAKVGDSVTVTVKPGYKEGYLDIVSLSGAKPARETQVWEDTILDVEEEMRGNKKVYIFKFGSGREAATLNEDMARGVYDTYVTADSGRRLQTLKIDVRPGRLPNSFELMGVKE